MKLYLKAFKLHLASAMEYKLSFILQLISQITVVFTSYFTIYSLIEKFGTLKNFSLYEILLCYGIANFGFSFNDCFFRGIDKFEKIIKNGSFDILLIRPKSILYQVLIQEIDFNKLSRAIQYFIIIIISIIKCHIKINLLNILTIIFMILGAILIFLGIMIINASYCFLTIEGLEVRNVISYGGRHMCQYPMGIYPKKIIIFFTTIIPFALVNYYPLLFLLGKSSKIIYMFCPLITIIYLIPCILLFNLGVKKYSSVGC